MSQQILDVIGAKVDSLAKLSGLELVAAKGDLIGVVRSLISVQRGHENRIAAVERLRDDICARCPATRPAP